MIISLSGVGSETLLADLDSAGVEYMCDSPRVGVLMNAGTSIQFINDLSGAIPWVPIASVIIAWLKYRPSRKVTVVNEKKEILRIEGYTTTELASLLSSSKSLRAIETKKPDE